MSPRPSPVKGRGKRWLSRAALLLLAFAVAWLGTESGLYMVSDPLAAALGIAQALPLVLVLIRPLAAWWAQVIVTMVIALIIYPYGYSTSGGYWPWTELSVLVHPVILVLVAARQRPRVAVELWVITVLMGLSFTIVDLYAEGVLFMAVLSATLLAITVAVHGWLEAGKRAAEQETLTETERAHRTLLEERTRIARELHDVVAHHMSVIAIQSEAAPYRVKDPPEELARSFAIIRENALQALSELRRVLGVLRSEDAAGQPTAPQPTLNRLADLVANVREAGVPVELSVSGVDRPVPQGVELSAFRIVQEALSNVLRHAPGASARVEIAHVLTGVGLRVVNTPTERGASSHGVGHGVLGMRERAAMLGGELRAGPTEDGGFEVVAFLPLAAEPGSAASWDGVVPGSRGASRRTGHGMGQ